MSRARKIAVIGGDGTGPEVAAEGVKVMVGAAAGIEQGGVALVTVAFLGLVAGSFCLSHDLPGIVDGISCAVVPPKGAEIAVGAAAGIEQGSVTAAVGSLCDPDDLAGIVDGSGDAELPAEGAKVSQTVNRRGLC